MPLKRTALTAIVIAAVAAANAPAMPIGDPGSVPVVPNTIEPGHGSSRFTELLALRKALRDRELPRAESVPVVPLAQPAADGFDWRSAMIGAAVPLALLLIVLAARPAIARRRRTRLPAHA